MNATITCIEHSGFLYQDEQVNLIFDYYTDPEKIISPALFQGRKTYVFVSHAHPDHYSHKIKKWQTYAHAQVTYILDAGIAPFSDRCTLVNEGDRFTLDGGIEVIVCGSTDIGVSFIVKLADRTLYHAGDLNDWYWEGEMSAGECAQMEAAFLDKVDTMRGIPIDVAFFPVDARLGPHAAKGVFLYQQRIQPRMIIPMHFFGGTDQLALAEQALAGSGVRFITRALPGDTITL